MKKKLVILVAVISIFRAWATDEVPQANSLSILACKAALSAIERQITVLNRHAQDLRNVLRTLETIGEGTSDVFVDVPAVPITDFEFGTRARKRFRRLGVRNLRDLLFFTEEDLLQKQQFGATSLAEINQVLSDHGLSLPLPNDPKLAIGALGFSPRTLGHLKSSGINRIGKLLCYPPPLQWPESVVAEIRSKISELDLPCIFAWR